MALSRVRNTAQKQNSGTPLSIVASHLIHLWYLRKEATTSVLDTNMIIN